MCYDGEVQNHSSVWRVSSGEYTPTDCQCSEPGAAERSRQGNRGGGGGLPKGLSLGATVMSPHYMYP